MSDNTSTSRKKSPGERIFAVDRRVWRAVCDLGLNEAITYLVIASGTGGDQRTSYWSATAVENHTGIHHRHGRPALRRLQENGFLSTVENGKLRRHTLHPPDRVPLVVAAVIKAVKGKAAIEQAMSELAEPQWIWLPNSLVECAAEEMSPIRLLQEAQEIDAVRLFIDLYYFHDLVASSGVEWRTGIGVRELYLREEVAQHGVYKVWAFTPNGQNGEVFRDCPFWFKDFWKAWGLLSEAGLVEFVTHLVSSDLATGQVLHPLPRRSTGEPPEREITSSATEAGRQWASFYNNPKAMLVPVLRSKPNVQLIGIARLKYRPHTARTAEWLSRSEEWKKIAMAFQRLTEDDAVGGIKEASRWGQGCFNEGST